MHLEIGMSNYLFSFGEGNMAALKGEPRESREI